MGKHALPLCLVTLLVGGFALKAQDYDYVANTFDTNSITITAYLGADSAVTIPSTIDGLTVTAIGDTAFAYDSGLESVSIPSTVTNLSVSFSEADYGYGTFQGCDFLTNVVMTNGLLTIGAWSFGNCSRLTTVTIPPTVTAIGDYAFNGRGFITSGLTGITLPSSVTSLGQGVFEECGNLKSISLPGSIGGVPYATFAGCSNLASVTIDAGISNISQFVFNVCPSLTNITFPAGITSVGDSAFEDATNLTGVFFQGNAPAFGNMVFYNDNKATVYHLSATTGWPDAVSYRPTALWNPLIRVDDGDFGLHNSRFGFNITGAPGIPVRVEQSSDPKNGPWVSVQTLTLTNGSVYFSAPMSDTSAMNVFRVSPPQ